MHPSQFEQEKEEILFLLERDHYLKPSTNKNKFTLCDDEHNPIRYYSVHLLNNLLDEKLIKQISGKFILNN